MSVKTNCAKEDGSSAEFKRKPNPFANMHIWDNTFLSGVHERQPCPKCCASRKFFCYTCYVRLPNVQVFPIVQLPVKIDIIKHRKETDGKSTSAHAAILAPNDVRIYEYPDIPDYTSETGVVLIYPSQTSVNVHSLFTGCQQLDTSNNYGLPAGHNVGTLLRFRLNELTLDDKPNCPATYDLTNLPVKRAVFIDSTWNQSRSIYKDPKIRSLQCVVLQNRLSQFWRHQKGSPRWYLSTVEAVHQFLLEVHLYAWGLDPSYRGLDYLELNEQFMNENLKELCKKNECSNKEQSKEPKIPQPYNGQYDNLLFLFTHMYGLIHTYYDHNQLKAYKRPIT